ncbi:MAG: pesticidal protein Cry15Aa [Anaerolineae bacterium]|nr:pesticidal protein Cry15Aa [Anaerolineae bacterium]HNS38659.1 polyhydroxyalkanoate synthesis regulator DNA-binding domain-containing protein [Promineifilum sp.]
MPVIKRYPNRKLYDTDAKRYVTLNEIAALIRAGEEVSVMDHATDEDLTAVVLTQIIFEQEKQQKGFLPKSVLTNLVRAGGDTIGTLRRGLNLPLDLWRHVDEEIDRRVQELITKGELAREEGVRLREKLLSPMVSGPGAMPDEAKLEQLLSEHGVPTREELDRLYAQLEALSSKLDGMLNQGRAEEPQS